MDGVAREAALSQGESLCIYVCDCAAVLRPYSHKDCGSFLLCGSYFDMQHHLRN